MFLQQLQAAHDFVERRLLAFVDAIGVVHFRGAIDGEADEEIVRGEEFAPFVVEQRAVGLDGVGNDFTAREFFLERDDFAEKIDAEQGGFAALPGEIDFGDGLAMDVLADVFLQHRVAHAPLVFAGIEIFLFEIETIFAIEVANRPDRFGQDVKRSSGVRDRRLVQAGGL